MKLSMANVFGNDPNPRQYAVGTGIGVRLADETDDVLVTPEGEVLDQTVLGTAKIDLSRHKRTRANWDLLRSTKFAVAGLIYVLVREKSIRWVSAMTIAAVVAGFWLEIPIVYWAVLTISIGIVWITECLNTAIEATIDMEASRPHSMATMSPRLLPEISHALSTAEKIFATAFSMPTRSGFEAELSDRLEAIQKALADKK